MECLVVRYLVVITIFLISIPAVLLAEDSTAAAAADSSGVAISALQVDSSAQTPPEGASTEAAGDGVLLPAEPVAIPTATGAAKPVDTTSSEFPITLDEVKALLARNETPRIRITNRYGGVVTGRAVEIVNEKLNVNVSGEALGVDGVVGVPLTQVVSMQALVPLSDQERTAAEKATADYIAGIHAAAESRAAQKLESTAPEGFTQAAEAAIESSEAALAESTSTEAETVPEGERDLLAIYPPSEGWGPGKLGEIIRKSIVLHLHPFGKELDFTNDYDSWKQAYETKRVQQIEELTQLQDAGKPVPPDFQVLPELTPVPSLEGAQYAPSAPAGDKSAAPATGIPAPSAAQ